MGLRINRKRTRVAVSRAVHPHYRAVVESYLRPTGFTVEDLEFGPDGRTDVHALAGRDDLAAVALQSPNFFGVIEDMDAANAAIHATGSLAVAAFTEPLAFGLLKNPGVCGADIACGEGQSFGIAPSFGGPGLGMFGCRKEHMRSLPGRLVGETRDLEGRRGYVLTLATREQHIRREKATSNICSNQGLCALTAAMYLASLGGTGLRRLARLNHDKAHYLRQVLVDAGARLPFTGPVFNEFVAEFPHDFAPVRDRLLARGIVAGLELGAFYPELAGRYLFCVTETIEKKDMDAVAAEVRA